MGLTTILRGFKVPIAVLDRFLESNGVEPTWGDPRLYNRLPLPEGPPIDGSDRPRFPDRPTLDPQSTFLRTKLAAAGAGDTSTTRIFIPHRQGQSRSTHAYVAYAYVPFFGQRKIDVAAQLRDSAPPGFAELRREILGFANEGAEEAALLFPLAAPFLPESYLHCDHCPAVFVHWIH